MERLSERLTAIEAVLKKLEPVEGLLERVALLENTIYTTKKVFTFQEACMYIGVSESMLYKLTSNKEIPHYKPRGKIPGADSTTSRISTTPSASASAQRRANTGANSARR